MRAADAAGWLAAFGAEDVAVTVRFPQLGGWEVTSWAVAPGDAEGSPALEVEIWAADFDYPALEGVLRGLRGRRKCGGAPGECAGAPPAGWRGAFG